jgi:hypothetical protein
MSKPIKPRNASDVIDILGGTVNLAGRLRIDPRVVSNWRRRGLPRDTQYIITAFLSQKGVAAPPALWRQREIAK